MLGLYVGSFDPLTLGHENIIVRASKVFDKLIVAVPHNEQKKSMLTKEERVEIIKETVKNLDLKNVEVTTFKGLLVDFAKCYDNICIVKGVRDMIDFEQELSMAQGIKNLDNKIETVFLPTEAKFSFISSSMVKSVLYYDGDISTMVNDTVLKKLIDKKEGTKYE